MTSCPGKQILGQYMKALSINNYGACPAMAPAAQSGTPCHCKGMGPIRDTKKKGHFCMGRSLDTRPPKLHF